MHDEALSTITKAVWEKCGFLGNMYLAGGTSLALQIGHRRSVDLDFFSTMPIKKSLRSEIEKRFASVIPIVQSGDELTVMVDDVKLTALHYPFVLLYEKVKTPTVPLASVADIASMKAYTLGRRQSLKDYVDLHAILVRDIISLSSIIADAQKKYGDAFNDRLFCEQLLFTDDLENEPIDWIGESISKDDMKPLFKMKITEVFA
ncbi:MAG: hypothetical protein UY70_C0005G0033 [Candidatus Kaiserbacteria bacterium GW2011_GWB1_52_6]|uniref:Nucleotidyl transferase AbiEii/AbiGii toxin family protein n=3 Tax=Candidatus Kaiseribacteriota TaxID=1752734 RepID=A0A0G1XM54_9BACT|nr:MAG: hypothetical protein UY67_C0004G0028 [Candidatus Kaiserbacteria bacterium GW2011_GWA2_52_12]KKW27969.1 MAG: hypothetical protein UY70_C0005G0033 [Candidatus Kaiserbacteria bacterium GW2011_GWB1_52_6]KKW31986.1 MAG: hypothetical protein UY74_C0002G0022 [Candidatus Kaiserbacteria bacterium GW2011_GWC2_52_8b]